MGSRFRRAGLMLLLASCLAAPSFAAAPTNLPPPVDQALGRALLKTLIETDTTHAKGSTGLASTLAARFLAEGFAPTDVTVLAPPNHPTKGNLIVRLHGRGQAKPVLYIGHLDVVTAKREDWTSDPFVLTEKDGYFYGRGTIDMKSEDAAMIESLIRLKREGFSPEGDIILALTADEEAEGDANGVDWLLKTYRDLIDAGLVMNPDSFETGLINGQKLYLGFETSEKVYATWQVEATDKGGHSSRPTPANPIYRLSKALTKLSDYRFPLDLTPTVKAYFERRAKLESGQMAADMESLASPSPGPDAVARLSELVDTNVLMRTTCIATQISGGHAESALPQRARATLQCRVIPGEPLPSIRAQLVKALDDPSLVVSEVDLSEESPDSPLSAKVMHTVEQVTQSLWPKVVIIPTLEAGASDNAFTRIAGIPSYGVDAAWEDLQDGRAHGRDERIGVEVFDQQVEWTYRLMKALGVQTKPLG